MTSQMPLRQTTKLKLIFITIQAAATTVLGVSFTEIIAHCSESSLVRVLGYSISAVLVILVSIFTWKNLGD